MSSTFGRSIDRNKSIFFNPEMTCPWWLNNIPILMSELWFPYKSIVCFCSSLFNSLCKFCHILF